MKLDIKVLEELDKRLEKVYKKGIRAIEDEIKQFLEEVVKHE